MSIFKFVTPFIYWLLIISWAYISIFYLKKYRSVITQDKLIKTLLIILSIDSLRTVIESIYFGAWYTSLSGIIPISVFEFLAQPQIVFIPKLLNLFAASLVIAIMTRKWIPQEAARLKDLQDIVSRQVIKITQTQDVLSETQARLQMVLEDSGIGIWDLDVIKDHIYCSGKLFSTLGHDLNNKYVSLKLFTSLINQEDAGSISDVFKDCISNKVNNFQIDCRFQFANGEWRWIQISGRTIEYDEKDTSVRLVGAFLDINDRKKSDQLISHSLKEKETLLQEIHHRTKNNMNLIYSMMKLSSNKYSNEQVDELVKETGSRIKSMSLVHQKLYQSKDLSHIDTYEYIDDLTKLLFQVYKTPLEKVSVVLDIEKFSILIDTAIPLGLILNELLSNSLKYAFPGDKKGKIKIRISRNNSGEINFIFSDDGIGVESSFDYKKQETLGFKMIFGIAEQQLGGKVSFDGSDGLSIQIKFSDTLYMARV
ncbi:MAG: PAS domain-containing protein [Spirochaetia bacterium]|jgi:two-component sensor histidine kinase/PAS domain-containing protein|nr:PAS domain-containing protein [Spirochaetia bacterium]